MNVEIISKQEVDLQEYYVLRGIRGGSGEGKHVVSEREFTTKPSVQDVANLLWRLAVTLRLWS